MTVYYRYQFYSRGRRLLRELECSSCRLSLRPGTALYKKIAFVQKLQSLYKNYKRLLELALHGVTQKVGRERVVLLSPEEDETLVLTQTEGCTPQRP